MADKFYDGMPNVNEKLNEMDRAFAAGPYNSLPLSGGNMKGTIYSNAPIITSQYVQACAYGPGAIVNTGMKTGWWRIGKFNPAQQGTEASIRVSGTTSYSAIAGMSNAMVTIIQLRVDNDSKIRSVFHNEGGMTNNTVSEVTITDDGQVYILCGTFFSLAVYCESSCWQDSDVSYYGVAAEPPAGTLASSIFGLKLGAQNTVTFERQRTTFDSSSVLIGPKQIIAGGISSTLWASALRAPNDGVAGGAGTYYETLSMGVASVPGYSNAGRFFWSTRSHPGSNGKGFQLRLNAVDASWPDNVTPVMDINGTGDITLPGVITAGPVIPLSAHQLTRRTAEFGELCYVGRVETGVTSSCFAIRASNGAGGWGNSASVAYVGRNSTTARSISAAGTINAGGTDYAEYMLKAPGCMGILPGQIIGIDVDGKLTDQWQRAIAFAVKSTDPCMVGGDRWARHLGDRPVPVERLMPSTRKVLLSAAVDAVDAVREEVDGKLVEVAPAVPAREAQYRLETIPGDTDEEWDNKCAPGLAFEAALEAARQQVDRIAFCGQVPVNVLDATPGQYIVPVQKGEGIGGLAVHEDDMTFKLYLRAIGKVIATEDDGRARVIVKVA
ncbi:hypothetical protein ACWYXK_08510 [Janthinobacterium lividum]